MTINTGLLDSQLADIRRAFDHFEHRQRTELFDGAGKGIYSDVEHKKRLAAFLAPVEQAAEEARELAQNAIAEASSMATAAHRNLLTAMSTEELQRAQALREFVKEDAETMPFAELAMALQAALVYADAPTKELYRRYGQKRLDATNKAMHENRLRLLPAETQALADVRLAVQALGAALNDSPAGKERAAKVRQAEELRDKAVELLKTSSDLLFKAQGGPDRAREAAAQFTRQNF
jgi:hypothetical protein